jgi:hypothetical protein
MATDYIDGYKRRIRQMPIQPPPAPWKEIATLNLGGVAELGFADDSELLLVVSHDGRGVFDCRTGERIARERQAPADPWYDAIHLTCVGIGPLSGKTLRIAGLHGGGLPVCTSDEWSLEYVAPDWPDGSIILQPSGSSIFDERRANGCVKIADVEELRAFGFSYTGKTLVIAMSHTLMIFGR